MLTLSVVFAVLSSISVSAEIKIDTLVKQTLAVEKTADVIVHLKSAPDLVWVENVPQRQVRARYVINQLVFTAEQTQKSLVNFLKSERIEYRTFYISNRIQIPKASEPLIAKLKSFPEIVEIRPNIKFRADLPRTAQSRQLKAEAIPSHLVAIGVDRVWKELKVKGKGIVVASQDTGVMWNHAALRAQYRGMADGRPNHAYNWHDSIHNRGSSCGADAAEPCDDNSHGTHTVGTIVGHEGDNNIGVAPEAQWISCRNMDSGFGTVATYLECFEFMLAPYPMGRDPRVDGRPDMAPHVINNSWGCPSSEGCRGDEFLEAVRALSTAGIVPVVSAGNEGPGCGTVGDPPALYAGDVVSVGAYNHVSKEMAYFSSRGPSAFNGGVGIDIVAPGVNIRSAIPYGAGDLPAYEGMSGTSMAGPHIAGVVALLWSYRPELIGNVKKTVEIIQNSGGAEKSTQTCGKFPGGKTPNAVFGYGLIDAYKALTKY